MMMVLTQTRTEVPSETKAGVVEPQDFPGTEDWISTPLAGTTFFDRCAEPASKVIEDRAAASVLRFHGGTKLSLPSITRYHVEQEFEGTVLEVDKEKREFLALLVDETDLTAADEEVLMSFSEISKDDLDLIVPGAFFSWIMGRTERNGIIQRHSEIRFRRLFKFSKQAIAIAEAEAADLYSLLDEV